MWRGRRIRAEIRASVSRSEGGGGGGEEQRGDWRTLSTRRQGTRENSGRPPPSVRRRRLSVESAAGPWGAARWEVNGPPLPDRQPRAQCGPLRPPSVGPDGHSAHANEPTPDGGMC